LTKRRKDDVCDVERETIIFVGHQSFGLNPIWKCVSQSDDVVQPVIRRFEGTVKKNLDLIRIRKTC
jgi:hypothetical protein